LTLSGGAVGYFAREAGPVRGDGNEVRERAPDARPEGRAVGRERCAERRGALIGNAADGPEALCMEGRMRTTRSASAGAATLM